MRINLCQMVLDCLHVIRTGRLISFQKTARLRLCFQKALTRPKLHGPCDVKVPVAHASQLKIEHGGETAILPQEIGR